MDQDFSSFLNLVDELRKRGAVEISAALASVKFASPYTEDKPAMPSVVRADSDAKNTLSEVPIEYYSSS